MIYKIYTKGNKKGTETFHHKKSTKHKRRQQSGNKGQKKNP